MPGKPRQQSQSSPAPVKVHRKGMVNPLNPTESAVPLNRGATIQRTKARTIKRQALNQTKNDQSSLPRPTVRPSAPPQRVMPKNPVKKTLQPVRPVASPSASAQLKSVYKPSGSTSPKQIGSKPARPTQVSGKTSMSVATIPTLNVGSAHAEVAVDVSALSSSLEEVNRRSSFSDLLSDVQALDENIRHGLSLLESARKANYVYQKDLDEIAYQSSDRWESIRDEVLKAIDEQSKLAHSRIRPLANDVRNLNLRISNPTAALPLIKSTKAKVDNLLGEINQLQRSIENRYDDIESAVYRLTSRLTSIHWVLKQLDEAKFKLNDHENLLMAVAARWDKEGKDDPEGILFLTDQRLIFEQKEKVAKKKVLFISVEKELIQDVLIDQPIQNIKNTKAESKGLFGHQDFIQVEFSEPNLESISLHLDGQDSKDWVNWIGKVRSGEISKDQATGSGISHSDLTGALTIADILSVQSEVNQLQDEMMLKAVRQELAGIENDVRALERKLSELRAHGYVLEKSLETDISILAMQWDRIKRNAEGTLELQAQLLNEQMKGIHKLLAELVGLSEDLRSARPVYMKLKSEIASAEAQAEASEDTVVAQYDEYGNEVETLGAYLEWIEWMLDALATASFQLLATESGISATEATWERPGLEPENGILFLTDQRLLWEDRVEAYELKLDIPLQNVSDVSRDVVEGTDQQRLVFTLNKSTPYPNVVFALNLPVADSWLKMIGRARSGEYLKDRAEEIDRVEIERIQNAPTQCSKCGAAFTSPILRGQLDIACEYCGTVTRI
jgi:hypothetical protein